MTIKKLKNANIVINSKLAEFCEKYGKKTVAFLSKPCGPFDDADIIKVIEGIESCLEEKCGVISIIYHCGQTMVGFLPEAESFTVGNCSEGHPSLVIPVYDASEYDEDVAPICDMVPEIVDTLTEKWGSLDYLMESSQDEIEWAASTKVLNNG